MNFKEILEKLSIPICKEASHHVRPGWIGIDCPFCGRDTQKWHMGYSIEKNFCSCWRCGSHPVINTLMEATRLSYHEIKKLLGDLDAERIIQKPKVQGRLILPKGIKQLHSAHKKYLKARGFNWRRLERIWHVKGIGIAAKLKWRIYIPIYFHGQVVSWTTRSISNTATVRYVSAGVEEESIPHKELLYGEDLARLSIVVVEGIPDVWRIGPGAVGTFGTNYSTAQVLRMSKYRVRAICFDNEPEAQTRAKQLANDLSVFRGDTYNIVLDKKDPAEETKENIKRIRKEFLE